MRYFQSRAIAHLDPLQEPVVHDHFEAVLGRAFFTTAWRNFIKDRSERRPDRRTPAMMVSLTDRPWSWRHLLRQRLFPSREPIPDSWLEIYAHSWTPGLPVHAAKHAY